jgi:hypothetical protein
MILFELFYQDPSNQLKYHLNCCCIKKPTIEDPLFDSFLVNRLRLLLVASLFTILLYVLSCNTHCLKR